MRPETLHVSYKRPRQVRSPGWQPRFPERENGWLGHARGSFQTQAVSFLSLCGADGSRNDPVSESLHIGGELTGCLARVRLRQADSLLSGAKESLAGVGARKVGGGKAE